MTDYDFYLSDYHGNTIPADGWAFYEARAVEQLEQYRRIYTVDSPGPGREERAVCAMAEALYNFDLLASGEGGPVQSASIGSVSVSYSCAAAQTVDLSPKGQARELYRCACRYLDICRGVR